MPQSLFCLWQAVFRRASPLMRMARWVRSGGFRQGSELPTSGISSGSVPSASLIRETRLLQSSLPEIGLLMRQLAAGPPHARTPGQHLALVEVIVADYREFRRPLAGGCRKLTAHALGATAAGSLPVFKHRLHRPLPHAGLVMPDQRVILTEPLAALRHAYRTVQAPRLFHPHHRLHRAVARFIGQPEGFHD